jgi:hypothetical protein
MESDESSLIKWASIQRLPTVARLRRGLLTTPEGDSNEIDVHKIGLQERTYLLQRLLRNNTDEVDNDQSFLLKLMRDRIDRYVCMYVTIFFLLLLHEKIVYTSLFLLCMTKYYHITELELIFLQLKFDLST